MLELVYIFVLYALASNVHVSYYIYIPGVIVIGRILAHTNKKLETIEDLGVKK